MSRGQSPAALRNGNCHRPKWGEYGHARFGSGVSRRLDRAMQTMERPPVAPVNRRPRRPAPWPVEFYRSAVGKKWVMALTGIGLMAYVFAHMFGNLKLYFGAEDLNHYSEFLRELLVPILPRTWTLWLLRVWLIVAFVFHIHAAASLTLMNRRAHAEGRYVAPRDWQAANAPTQSTRSTRVALLSC